MIVSSTLLVWLSLTAPAPAALAEAVEGDLARLQGTWTASVGTRKKMPVTIEIRDRAVSVVIRPPVGPPIVAKGQVRLDVGASPKALDWVRLTASDGQEFPEILGIFEFDGDSLRICTGGLNNPRPAAFEPGESLLSDVVTFRRPKAPAPAGRPAGDVVSRGRRP